MNNYLSVLMIQLQTKCECNSLNEYVLETPTFQSQMSKAFELVEKTNPDIVLFPETTYCETYEETYLKLCKNRLFVAGSTYIDGINTTIVFENGVKKKIPKRYASGAEPMTRKITFIPPEEFISKYLGEHEFHIKGKKIYLLNCMEYYHTAYYIARDPYLQRNLFGIFAICSNNNVRVFEEETVCIHNHIESIYTFVLNRISVYQGKSHSEGKSYIYGPISIHEKEWLNMDGIESKKNVCHILNLSDTTPQAMYGEFLFHKALSRFGRSDKYTNNPRNIQIFNLLEV